MKGIPVNDQGHVVINDIRGNAIKGVGMSDCVKGYSYYSSSADGCDVYRGFMSDTAAGTENVLNEIKGLTVFSSVTSVLATAAYRTGVGAPIRYLLDKASLGISMKADALQSKLDGSAPVGSVAQGLGSVVNMGNMSKLGTAASDYSAYSLYKALNQNINSNTAVSSYTESQSPIRGRP